MHLTASPVDWYAVRAAGVVAYVLLTAVVCLGLALSSRRPFERWPRFALEDVHRFAGLLVGVFVVLHVATIAADSYLRFSVAAIVVPFASSYRPVWTGLGVVAAELLLALAVTNGLRRRGRLSYRRWRRLHYATFAVWAAATLHGLVGGSDRGTWWLLALQAAAVALVCGGVARRLGFAAGGAAVTGLAAAAAVGVVATVVFPFRPHTWNARTFHDRLSGEVSWVRGPSRELVSLDAAGVGPQRVLLRADLLVEPQGLLATRFQLEFLPSGMRCAGRVTRLDPFGFQGRCRARDGTVRYVHAAWPATASHAFTGGTLDAHA